MRKLLIAVFAFLLTAGLWAQTAPPATDDAAQLRQEIDQLKKTVQSLEQRFAEQEQAKKSAPATESPTPTAAPANEAISDLQASVRYPGGLALRLARVKRYRDDKRPEDADTMDAVRKIYAAQSASTK